MKQQITRIVAIHFSPGGTGHKVIRTISETIAADANIPIEEIDMLEAENRQKSHRFGRDTLVLIVNPTAKALIGVPKEMLEAISGDKTPCVPLVMYGNGSYGNALKYMDKWMKKRGFVTVAAAAFIGQHSVRAEIATGRPDNADLIKATDFGKRIYHKIFVNQEIELKESVKDDWQDGLSGVMKPKLLMMLAGDGCGIKVKQMLRELDFSDACTLCETCVDICPTDALCIVDEKVVQDVDACVGCYACAGRCPENAIMCAKVKEMQEQGKMPQEEAEVRKEPMMMV